MVHPHEVERARADDALPVEFAAAAQHLAEPLVVGHGAGEPATAGDEAGRPDERTRRRVVVEHRRLVRHARVVGGEAVHVVGRHLERSVHHAQRPEDVPLQVVGQWLTGHQLDERAAHVGGQRVHVGGARLEAQWHPRQLVHELGHRLLHTRAADLLGAIERIDGVLVAHARQGAAVGEPARVAEQIAERHRPTRGLRDHRVAFARHPHAVIAPRGDDAGDGVVELEHPLLEQLHQRDGHDRLRHRVDAEDRVVAHRNTPLAIALAQAALVGEVAAPADGHLAAGDLARPDVVPLQVRLDALQPLCIEPGRCRLQLHDVPPRAAPGDGRGRGSHAARSTRHPSGRALVPPSGRTHPTPSVGFVGPDAGVVLPDQAARG